MLNRAWLTVDEVSEKLGISKTTVREKLNIGEIQGKKVGRDWRILPNEINRLLGITSSEDELRKELYIKDLEKENEVLKLKIESFKTILSSLNTITL